jgi:hypothetical protein
VILWHHATQCASFPQVQQACCSGALCKSPNLKPASIAPWHDLRHHRALMTLPLRHLWHVQMAWVGVLEGSRRRLIASAIVVSSARNTRPERPAVSHALSIAAQRQGAQRLPGAVSQSLRSTLVVNAMPKHVTTAETHADGGKASAPVLAQVLALYGCLAWVQLSLRPDYILVIDCGSTGTRM